MSTPVTLRSWFASLRAFSFTASIMPAALAVVIAVQMASVVPETVILWWTAAPYLAAALLFHAGTNVLNDYWDYRHGVDGTVNGKPDPDPTHAISQGTVSPRFMLISGNIYYLLGILLGSLIALQRGTGYLAAGLAGALGGYLYTGGRFSFKYRAMGDVAVFLLMGPALVLMGVWSLTGSSELAATLPSVPMALLVTAILHGNNLRDIHRDRAAGIHTLAGGLGFRRSRVLFVVLCLGAYVVIAVMVWARVLPALTLLVLATLPVTLGLTRRVLGARDGSELIDLPLRTAQLHLLFSAAQILAMTGVILWPT